MKQDEARLPVLFPYSSSGVVRAFTNTPCNCKALYGWGLDRTPHSPGDLLKVWLEFLE